MGTNRAAGPADSQRKGLTKMSYLFSFLCSSRQGKSSLPLSLHTPKISDGVMKMFRSGKEYELRAGRILIQKI